MTLTTHAAIGAAIGTFIGNPLLGFALGIASHFLVDMIPHGDNNISDRFRVQKKKKLALAYLTTDAALAIILLMFLVGMRETGVSNVGFTAAVVGSILPDFLVGLSDIYKQSKVLKKFCKLHFFFHDFFSRKYGDAPLSYALAAQAVFVLLIINLI